MRFFLFLSILFVSVSEALFAQQNATADKIVAIVGRNRIILQSELEAQVTQFKLQDSTVNEDTLRCVAMQQMLIQKLLVEQADRDSLMVGDEEVEATLDNRLRYFIRAYGGRENMEQALGKTVYQLKEEYRDVIREQMQADRMQDKILANVKVTPAEVKKFYDKQDTLPLMPATIEVGQIVIEPKASPEVDAYAKSKLEDIRKQIVEGGKDFEIMSGIYSDDPVSRDNGGRINGVSRNAGLVPEFVTQAMRLQNGEISPVFKTRFGYHIIQMINRKGEEADVRHILIRPEPTSADFKLALTQLDSVRAQLLSGKITFNEAVGKYSNDDASKMTGGMITNPQTGSAQLQVADLDPALALMLDSLQIGSYSQPQVYNMPAGGRATRIVYLVNRTAPHRANLKDDYNQIMQVALGEKKNKLLEQWLEGKLSSYYIFIDSDYHDCPVLQPWVQQMVKH